MYSKAGNRKFIEQAECEISDSKYWYVYLGKIMKKMSHKYRFIS